MSSAVAADDRPLVLSERKGDVFTLTLNRPEAMNATMPGMIPELAAKLDAALEAGARAIVLTGAGKGFCAGAYLKGGPSPDGKPKDMGEGLEKILNPLIEKMMSMPVPVITAVNGGAVGAGMGLALAGDIVLMSKSAYYLVAFARVGLVPDAGLTWQLPRIVGRHRALELMYLAEKLPADEAVRLGLANRVVDDAELMQTAGELAERLASGPTASFAAMRRGVAASLQDDLGTSLAQEAVQQRAAGFRNDFAEGVAAFAQKRAARFTGS
ncbi:MAG: enoyl-CoA hydratase-related protein [Mesorhizobium sp.]